MSNKLIATFYYRGSEGSVRGGEILYRRVIVSTISERMLYGFETTRDITTHGPVLLPFKTFKLVDCSGLIIKYIDVPNPQPTLSLSARLRNIADEVEDAVGTVKEFKS